MITQLQLERSGHLMAARQLVGLSLETRLTVFADFSLRTFEALADECSAMEGLGQVLDGTGAVVFEGELTGVDGAVRRWTVAMGAPLQQVAPQRVELCSWGLLSDGYVVTFGVDVDGLAYEVLVFGEEDREVVVAAETGNGFAHVRHLERWAASHQVRDFIRHLRDVQRGLSDEGGV